VGSRTSRVRLGLGVAPAFTRPPTLLAMTAATVQALVGGRFCLGLGSSTEAVVGRWMGLPFDRPYTRVRETLEVVRRVLGGERFSFQGETVRVHDYRLQPPGGLPPPPPILLAALGPRMLRLAGAAADGVVLVNVAARALPSLLGSFWAGVDASGRARAQVDVVCRVGVALDEDVDRLRPLLRRELAGYGSTRPYNAFFRRQGFAVEAEAIRAAWERRDGQAAAAAVSDRMVDELFVVGDADACRARLRTFVEAGIRTLLIMPVSAHTDEDGHRQSVLRTIEGVARELAPSASA
jgi:probable F420-dependent oxidoreductase